MNKNPKKRLIINLVAFLIIGAVAFLASRFYSTGGAPSQAAGEDFPKLSIQVVETKVEPAKIQAAVVLDNKSVSEEDFVADILEIYTWGRSYFRPYKCGDEYPPNLCQYGEVHIFVLVPMEGVPSTTGPVEVYMTLVELWLDQAQIDVLLSAQPTSFTELDEFHSSVAQQTEGTGGGATVVEEIFTGLK
jgi:hypothetical protein